MSKEIEKFKGGLINNSSIIKKGLEISKKAEDPFIGKSEEDIWNEAMVLYDKGDFNQSIKFYKKFIELRESINQEEYDLTIVRGLICKSIVESKNQNYNQAILDLDRSLPNLAEYDVHHILDLIFNLRGFNNLLLKNYEEAILDYKKSIIESKGTYESVSDYVFTFHNLSYAYHMNGQPDLGKSFNQEALKFKRNFSFFYTNEGSEGGLKYERFREYEFKILHYEQYNFEKGLKNNFEIAKNNSKLHDWETAAEKLDEVLHKRTHLYIGDRFFEYYELSNTEKANYSLFLGILLENWVSNTKYLNSDDAIPFFDKIIFEITLPDEFNYLRYLAHVEKAKIFINRGLDYRPYNFSQPRKLNNEYFFKAIDELDMAINITQKYDNAYHERGRAYGFLAGKDVDSEYGKKAKKDYATKKEFLHFPDENCSING